jgi:hypothetical protein
MKNYYGRKREERKDLSQRKGKDISQRIRKDLSQRTQS